MKKQLFKSLLASFALMLVGCGNQPAPAGPTGPTLSDINIADYQSEYNVDDAFNPTMTVTAIYSDGTSEAVTNYTYDDSEFDSSVEGDYSIKVTYKTITKSFTVTVVSASDPVVDLTISVTVSGISEYSGKHAYIWFSSNIETTDWNYKVMTQDTTNANKWSISFTGVKALQNYQYNFYYGSDTSPDWTNGKNVNQEGVENRTLPVAKTTTTFDDTAEFSVPSSSKTFTFVITPVVQTASDADPVAISDGVYLWAWSNNVGDNVAFTKGTDNKWSAEVEVEFGADGKGSAHFTFVLGTSAESAPSVWEGYRAGQWTSTGFEEWANGYTFDTLTEEGETVVNYTATFKQEPEVVDPTSGYTLTVTYVETGEGLASASSGLRVGATSGIWGPTWVAQFSDGIVSYVSSTNDFYFVVALWNSSHNGNYVVGSTNELAFHVTFDANVHAGSVTITFDNTDVTTATWAYAGVASNAVNCTVA